MLTRPPGALLAKIAEVPPRTASTVWTDASRRQSRSTLVNASSGDSYTGSPSS